MMLLQFYSGTYQQILFDLAMISPQSFLRLITYICTVPSIMITVSYTESLQADKQDTH